MNRFVSVILLIMIFNVGNVAAQQRVEPAEMFDKVFSLLGNWGVNLRASSLKRFIDIGNKAGADVLISTNNRHANTFEKIRTWRIMNPDESGGGNADGILAM